MRSTTSKLFASVATTMPGRIAAALRHGCGYPTRHGGRVGRDHHAGSDSRSRDEGQRALVHEPLQHRLRVELIADAPRDRHQLAKVLAHCLEPPAPVVVLGRTHTETLRFEDPAHGARTARNRDSMHGACAPTVRTQGDHDVVSVGISTSWSIVRLLGV